ncbi:MAG: hypothetical protein SGCHY_004332 [Lobulomycetales sp.]
MKSLSPVAQAAVNVLLFAAALTVNMLSAMGVGIFVSQRTISDRHVSWLTPDYFAFRIWTVIYILLAALLVLQCLPSSRDKPNLVWIFVFSAEWISFSTIVLAAMVFSLYPAYRSIARINASSPNWRDFMLIEVPVALYLGWIIPSTFANLMAAGSRATPEFEAQAIAVLCVPFAIVSTISFMEKCPVPLLSTAWSVFAIGFKWKDVPGGAVSPFCFAVTGVLVAEAVFTGIWRAKVVTTKLKDLRGFADLDDTRSESSRSTSSV